MHTAKHLKGVMSQKHTKHCFSGGLATLRLERFKAQANPMYKVRLIKQRPRDAGIACKHARTHKHILGPASTHPHHQRPPVALGCEMMGAGAAAGPADPLPWGSTWYTALTCTSRACC